MAYERVAGTLGPERDDLLHAITATTIANANRGKGKAPAKVTAFMPAWDRRTQSWEEQLAIVKQHHRTLTARADRMRKGGSRGDPVESAGEDRRRRRPR